jgi:hypothetical protein
MGAELHLDRPLGSEPEATAMPGVLKGDRRINRLLLGAGQLCHFQGISEINILSNYFSSKCSHTLI